MSFRKSAIMLSFAAAMSLLNTTAFAIDMSTSQVIKTTGKVSVKKTDSPEFKKLNSNLKLAGALKNLDGGDKVRTMNNSSAVLVLKDTCQLTVKEQSIFEVPKILTKSDLKAIKAQQGSVLFEVVKGSNFQVQTSDVICGVKGTIFSVTSDFTILETPGLQLGYNTQGGTTVEVFDGEVEVTNKYTNERNNLTKGQGIHVSKSGLKTIGKTVKYIFEAEQKYNKLWSDANLGNFGSEIKTSFEDSTGIRKVFQDRSYNEKKNIYNEIKSIKNDFKTKEYNANFSKYQTLNTVKTFNSGSFGEVYIGDNTLVACKAANGSKSLIAEPVDNLYSPNGITVLDGNGLIKMDTFNEKLGITNELLVNIYESGINTVTAIRNRNPNLQWREPGNFDSQPVPTGDVAYVYNRNTGKGYWAQAPQGIFPQELVGYNFSVINTMLQEKQQIQKQNEQKQKEAGEKLFNRGINIFKGGKKGRFGF